MLLKYTDARKNYKCCNILAMSFFVWHRSNVKIPKCFYSLQTFWPHFYKFSSKISSNFLKSTMLKHYIFSHSISWTTHLGPHLLRRGHVLNRLINRPIDCSSRRLPLGVQNLQCIRAWIHAGVVVCWRGCDAETLDSGLCCMIC